MEKRIPAKPDGVDRKFPNVGQYFAPFASKTTMAWCPIAIPDQFLPGSHLRNFSPVGGILPIVEIAVFFGVGQPLVSDFSPELLALPLKPSIRGQLQNLILSAASPLPPLSRDTLLFDVHTFQGYRVHACAFGKLVNHKFGKNFAMCRIFAKSPWAKYHTTSISIPTQLFSRNLIIGIDPLVW